MHLSQKSVHQKSSKIFVVKARITINFTIPYHFTQRFAPGKLFKSVIYSSVLKTFKCYTCLTLICTLFKRFLEFDANLITNIDFLIDNPFRDTTHSDNR